MQQITRYERRHVRLRRAREAAASAQKQQHAHHVPFLQNDPLPCSDVDLHHHISDSKNFPHHLMSFVQQPPHDPAKKVITSYQHQQMPLIPDHHIRTSFQNLKTTFSLAFLARILMVMSQYIQMQSAIRSKSSGIAFTLPRFFG